MRCARRPGIRAACGAGPIPSGPEGHAVDLHQGLHRLRRDHARDRRPLPVVAVAPGRHEAAHDDGRLGDPGDGRDHRDRGVAGSIGAPRRLGARPRARRRAQRDRRTAGPDRFGAVRTARRRTRASTTGRRPYGPATRRPRPCSTATGCVACSARPTARPRRSTDPALYDSRSLTWDEAAADRGPPGHADRRAAGQAAGVA